MKKTTLLISLVLIVLFSYGQKTSGRFNENRKEINKKVIKKDNLSSKAIGFTISADHNYIAGYTQKLHFNCQLTTVDAQYGAYFKMTFPAGFSPISGSEIIGATTFTGIEGQEISWGTEGVFFGGIAPAIFTIWVEVSIDAGIDGDQEIEFRMVGDGWSTTEPLEVNGTITLSGGSVPETPDLYLQTKSFMTGYHAIPKDQFRTATKSTNIQANIINLGSELTEATQVTSNGGTYSDAQNLTVPMATLNEQLIDFVPFTTNQAGDVEIILEANASNDNNIADGTDTIRFTVSETDYIRDNGDIIASVGFDVPGAELGMVFTLFNPDTLNSVVIYLGEPVAGDEVVVKVYEMTENGPGNLVVSSAEIILSGEPGEHIFYFAGEGFVLDAGDYLFAVKEGANMLSLAFTSDIYTYGTTWSDYYGDGGWLEGADAATPEIYYIRPQFGTKSPDFDIEVLKITTYNYYLSGSETIIKGQLYNTSSIPLTSYDISYTVNNGTPVTESFSGLSEIGIIDFEFDTKLQLSDVGEYNIKVSLTDPNGGPDANQSNDEAETIISALEYAPKKIILTEEGTGTWCGNCIRGIVGMKQMEELHSDNWIGIAVHNGDPMTVDEYDVALGPYIHNGYPGAFTDRKEYCDPLDIDVVYNALIDVLSPLEVSIENISVNGRELSFDVKADFLGTVEGARFNAVLIENEVTGTGSGWAQTNYYSGGGMGEMGGFENLPNPVPAEDMVYNHVARALLGGWDGTDGSLPTIANGGNSESYTYTVTIEQDWDIDNIEIIGFVIDKDGSVLNAAKSHAPIGIDDHEIDHSGLNKVIMYPNPFNNSFTISNLEYVSQIKISNIMGQIVLHSIIEGHAMDINTSQLESGIYFITLVDEHHNTRIEKLLKH